jgi:diguanylate cyclase (GGDEF)-like protein/PAS domain S-box-containing protein
VVQLTTQQKVSTAFAAAVGISIVIGVLSYASVYRLRDDAGWVAHTHEVIAALLAVLATAADAESAGRGYAITGSEAFLQPYNEAVGYAGTEIAKVRALTADNASQQRLVKVLEELVNQRMIWSAGIVRARRDRGFEGARELVATGRGERLHEAIGATVAEMVQAERRLLSERQTRTDQSTAAALHAIVAGSALALGIVLLAQLLIRRDFAGAQRAQHALREANTTLEERVTARTGELERANERLAGAYQQLRMLVAQAPLAIAMFDRDMRYIATSRRWIEDYGRSRNELTGMSHYEVHPDLPQRWTEVHRRGLAGELIKNDEDLWLHTDGSRTWLRWAVNPWRNEAGEIGGVIIFTEDITPRKHAEERQRFAQAVYDNVQEGIVITDLGGNILAVNPAFRTITEYAESELLGQNMRLLGSGRQNRPFYDGMWASIHTTGSWQGEIWNRRKGGEVYPQWLGISTVRDDHGEPTNYVGLIADISRMQHAESHLLYLAHHDALTGLPNRALLALRLRHTIERAQREETRCAVLFLDLDGFKIVNDQLGHQAGDELLQLAAARMKQRIRDIDTLARLGGDEFVLVLESISARSDVSQVAQALIEQLNTPFRLASSREVSIGTSIGISLFPVNGTDAESLVRHADAALYEAKVAGRSTWRFYDAEAEAGAGQRNG